MVYYIFLKTIDILPVTGLREGVKKKEDASEGKKREREGGGLATKYKSYNNNSNNNNICTLLYNICMGLDVRVYLRHI